ncbi:hypothetical protein [Chamaesiphon polymorphus]|uniref:hypothetical protein n=1 Tax=Chamaesiphon polymorphus TaxID=2107691 RepID=UPI001C6355F4|nr:hypothetical protein [Chamaesiphon polymorphus]
MTDSLRISKVEICIDASNYMTIATFSRELFAISELRFVREAWALPNRPSALFADESNLSANTDAHNLKGSARALATARKIFRVAKSRYGWSNSKIEDLLCKFHQNASFDGLDSIARTLIFTEASYNLAWLAEKSEDFSFWLDLNSSQREVLFSYASQLRDALLKFSQLNLQTCIDLFKRSFLFKVNFARFFLDCIDNHQKVIDNADRMGTIFEKSNIQQTRVLNFSNMTQAERDLAIEHYKNIRKANLDRLTPEELDKSNQQFDRAFLLLDESRN